MLDWGIQIKPSIPVQTNNVSIPENIILKDKISFPILNFVTNHGKYVNRLGWLTGKCRGEGTIALKPNFVLTYRNFIRHKTLRTKLILLSFPAFSHQPTRGVHQKAKLNQQQNQTFCSGTKLWFAWAQYWTESDIPESAVGAE